MRPSLLLPPQMRRPPLGPRPKPSQQLRFMPERMKYAEQTLDSEGSPPDERSNGPPSSFPKPKQKKEREEEIEAEDMDEEVPMVNPANQICSPEPAAEKKPVGDDESQSSVGGMVQGAELYTPRAKAPRNRFSCRRTSPVVSSVISLGGDSSRPAMASRRPSGTGKTKRTRNERNMSVDCSHNGKFAARIHEQVCKELVLKSSRDDDFDDESQSQSRTKSPFSRDHRPSQSSSSSSKSKANNSSTYRGKQSPKSAAGGAGTAKKPSPRQMSYTKTAIKYTNSDVTASKVVVIDLENMERIVGRKRLDMNGLKKGSPKRLGSGKDCAAGRAAVDANNKSVLYLYLELYCSPLGQSRFL